MRKKTDEGSTMTDEWRQYQRGVEYKRRLGLYGAVAENYRYLEGNQWGNTKTEGLPASVFNIIRPVLNYKISQIMNTSLKIIYQCGNRTDADHRYLSEVADVLTGYSDELWERLKMDNRCETLLRDSAVAGNGILYFYYNAKAADGMCCECVDSTNIYPANPNDPDIQAQEYVIIAFRRPVSQVREEAREQGLSEHDVEMIAADTDTQELAGDASKIEIDEYGMCIELLKLWKQDGQVHFRKSVKSLVIVEDENTELTRYPVAVLTWEKRKNCFFGVSDVTGLIPNQDYINTIAAMIMASTTFTAFPKMVYNEDYIDNPSNEVGTAIGYRGTAESIKNVVDYINPGQISADAFKMFETTIALTKELMGANDAALGDVNPDQASGKAIMAVVEQAQIPLEGIRRNYYDFVEDVALIWADMWRAYSANGRMVTVRGEDGAETAYVISEEAFKKLMLHVRIDVGPSTRWSAVAVQQSLDNLLAGQFIDFEMYIDLLPDDSGLPVKKMKELLAEKRQMMQEQQMAQMPQMQQEQAMPEPAPETEIDIDAMLAGLTDEERQRAARDPAYLEQLIAGQIGAAM